MYYRVTMIVFFLRKISWFDSFMMNDGANSVSPSSIDL